MDMNLNELKLGKEDTSAEKVKRSFFFLMRRAENRRERRENERTSGKCG